MGPDVSLVSSDSETAKDVFRQLVSRDLLASPDAVPTARYEATGSSADDFVRLAHRLMGREVREVQLVQDRRHRPAALSRGIRYPFLQEDP